MSGTGRVFLSALILSAPPAFAASDQALLLCSAELEARADWIDAMDGNPDTAEMLHRHAALLLTSYKNTRDSVDWNMVLGPAAPPDDEAERDDLALDALTRLVQAYPKAVSLPSCMEDEVCSECRKLLPY